MVGVTTAAIVGGVLGLGGTIAGGVLQGNAQRNAAELADQAAQRSLELQRQAFNIGQNNFQPFLNFGRGAIDPLSGLLGISPAQGEAQQIGGSGIGGGPSQAALQAAAQDYYQRYPDVAQAFQNLTNEDRAYIESQGYPATATGFAQFHFDTSGLAAGRQFNVPRETASQAPGSGAGPGGGLAGALSSGDQREAFLRATPGYQFAFNEGTRQLGAQSGLTGLLNSGQRAKAAQLYGQNLASGTLTQERNALFQALNVGTAAASQQASNASAFANNATNILQGNAATQGNAAINRASAFGNTINQGVGQFNRLGGFIFGNNSGSAAGGSPGAFSTQVSPGGVFSDRRLKDGLVKVGEVAGIGVYEWRWNSDAELLGLSGNAWGFIADEVAAMYPDAVTIDESGYHRVDYGAVMEAL